jgi:gliding motility-associated protein GldM
MSLIPSTIVNPVLLASSTFLAIFFSACSNKPDNNLIAFKALDESIINSTKIINRSSESIYMALENKLMDSRTNFQAKIWQPKAMRIQQLSKDMYDYIDELKISLKKEAGLKINEGQEVFRENDRNAVNYLFGSKGKAKELYERLKQYKRDILAIDSQMSDAFNNTVLLTTESFDTLSNKQQNPAKFFFNKISVIAALAILNKFQNNIKITENRMTSFCNENVSYGDYFTTYSPIITQSSSYVRSGEEIEIMAGIGAFSRKNLPEILINRINAPLAEDGAAHYKFKASNKPGKYSVPVKISYTDADGNKQWVEKNIEYTVAQK